MASRVLILEDEPLIGWDVEEELAGRGWKVTGTCGSTAQAQAALDAEVPDVAVMDVNLIGETSFDVARRCLSLGAAVVFLTGTSGDALPDDLRHVPICPKPVDYNLLHETLLRTTGAEKTAG